MCKIYLQVGHVANPSSFGWMVDGVCDGFGDTFRLVQFSLPSCNSGFQSFPEDPFLSCSIQIFVSFVQFWSQDDRLILIAGWFFDYRFIAFIFVVHRVLQSGKQGVGYSLLPVEIDTGWAIDHDRDCDEKDEHASEGDEEDEHASEADEEGEHAREADDEGE